MSAEMVLILDHPPTEQDEPVFHLSAGCPAVEASPGDYVPVPKWLVDHARVRACKHAGSCQMSRIWERGETPWTRLSSIC